MGLFKKKPRANSAPVAHGKCKLASCQAKFPIPAHARNKLFCSEQHRNDWHLEQRALAGALLRKAMEEELGAGSENKL
jgi:hypothetical protein